MELTEQEKVALYRGEGVQINEHIHIKVPILNDIFNIDEKEYFNNITTICSVGADLKWQLDELNIDYTKIDDYELFVKFLSGNISKNISKIIFNEDIDFSSMKIIKNEDIDDFILVQYVENIKETPIKSFLNTIRKIIKKPIKTKRIDNSYEITIDRYAYLKIVSILRYMHGLKRNNEKPMNEITKRFLIDEAKEEYEINKDKPFKSYMLNLISTLVNTNGFKHDETTVFNMNIVAFFDSVKRIQKITQSELLLQSGYSGFGIDLKKINKNDTNRFGDLD